MGQVKEFLMEFEERISILDDILILLKKNKLNTIVYNQLVADIYKIQNILKVNNAFSMSEMSNINEFFIKNLDPLYDRLKILLSEEQKYNSLDEINDVIIDFSDEISNLNFYLKNLLSKEELIFNSEDYYKEQIEELKKRKLEFEKFLIEQENQQGKTSKEIQEKEIALNKAKEKIYIYQKELEEKKKQENKIEEWDSKIKSTFEKLTLCIAPIKKEHYRLKCMFWIYSTLIVITLIFIAFLEVKIYAKFNSVEGFPEWKNYFSTLIPIPLICGLLWTFIIQVNRSQRQLVVLAKNIYEIKYVEGLLLSLNSLSSDISDSTKKVNQAIDKLLENHLNNNISNNINEKSIIKEENKDVVPYDFVIKLLKDAKGFLPNKE
ncbi:MAG: hypothetical protein WCS51_04465 [Bacilli bacterium]